MCVFEVEKLGQLEAGKASARMEHERVVRVDFSEVVRSNEHGQ